MKPRKCWACEGRGRVYDPRDSRDPVEGNKMRGVIPCHVCEGKGTMHHIAVRNHLKWCLKEYAT